MIKSIKKFLSEKPDKFAMRSLSIAIVLLIVFNVFIDCSDITNYTVGFATELLGALVAIVFIQRLLDKKSENDAKINEADIIKRSDKVMQLLIDRYITSFYYVATPLSRRVASKPSMPENFEFEDMRDLHKACSISKHGYKHAVDAFIEAELALRKYMISMLGNIDFKYHKEFSNILLEFIDASISCNSRDALLGAKHVRHTYQTKHLKHLGLEDLKEPTDTTIVSEISFIEQKITNQAYQEFTSALENGKTDDMDILYPYFSLYRMMKKEQELVLKYQEEIKRKNNC